MNLKCDELLSNVAFNFNVRRYNELAGRVFCPHGRAVQVDPGCIQIWGQVYTDIGSEPCRYRVIFIQI